MKKIIFMVLGLLVVSMFLVGCAPEEISDEELFAEMEELSDEELDVVLTEDEALAGQAYQRFKPEKTTQVRRTRNQAEKITWLSCTDSDGGKNSDVAGEVTLEYSYYGKEKSKTLSDKCSDDTIHEYYCKANKYARSTKICQFGCEAGACVAPECTDSDDGIDINTYGEVVASDMKGYLGTDYCGTDDGGNTWWVAEYYCENGELQSKIFNCPNGCVNGACVVVEEVPPEEGACEFPPQASLTDTTLPYMEFESITMEADLTTGTATLVYKFFCSDDPNVNCTLQMYNIEDCLSPVFGMKYSGESDYWIDGPELTPGNYVFAIGEGESTATMTKIKAYYLTVTEVELAEAEEVAAPEEECGWLDYVEKEISKQKEAPYLEFESTTFTQAAIAEGTSIYTYFCSEDDPDIECTIQLFKVETCTGIGGGNVFGEGEPPSCPGFMCPDSPGKYIYFIGQGGTWAEIYSDPNLKAYLITVTE